MNRSIYSTDDDLIRIAFLILAIFIGCGIGVITITNNKIFGGVMIATGIIIFILIPLIASMKNNISYTKLYLDKRLYFPTHKYKWMYAFSSQDDHVIDYGCFKSEELKTRIAEELIPVLSELYKKAEHNKETRRIFKNSIPQIKTLYLKFKSCMDAINNAPDNRVVEHIETNILDSIDDITEFISNLKKPIDDIIDYNESVKDSVVELERTKSKATADYILSKNEDYFDEIKEYNSLKTGLSRELIDKYDNIEISESSSKKKNSKKKKNKKNQS